MKLNYKKIKKSSVAKFREKWLKQGYELINITELCEFKLGCSGWCNNFNEPDEKFFHIQCWYRDEVIANFLGDASFVIDDDKYIIWINPDYSFSEERDFIIFRKVKVECGKK